MVTKVVTELVLCRLRLKGLISREITFSVGATIVLFNKQFDAFFFSFQSVAFLNKSSSELQTLSKVWVPFILWFHYSRKPRIYFIGSIFAPVVAKAPLIVFENFSFVSRWKCFQKTPLSQISYCCVPASSFLCFKLVWLMLILLVILLVQV